MAIAGFALPIFGSRRSGYTCARSAAGMRGKVNPAKRDWRKDKDNEIESISRGSIIGPGNRSERARDARDAQGRSGVELFVHARESGRHGGFLQCERWLRLC